MAFTDRNVPDHIRAPAPRRITELFAAALLLTLAAALGLRAYVSPGALAPVIVTLLFACAALTACAALIPINTMRRARWIDAAGVLTLVGVGISILIEPEQMIGLVTSSEHTE